MRRSRKRSYNSKPFLVIGGPHDGQTVNVLAAPTAPIENVIRLPLPITTNITEVRQKDSVAEYYVQQVRRAYPNHDKPWCEAEFQTYWFYCIDQDPVDDLTDQGQARIEAIFTRLREFYKTMEQDDVWR